MQLVAPQPGGPVVLPEVAAQLEQLLAAGELKLTAEHRASQVARTLKHCPVLLDVYDVIDAADACWRCTVQAVLTPAKDGRCTALQPLPTELAHERLCWLGSIVARAGQVRRIVAAPSTALGPQSTAALCDASFSIAHCMQELDQADAIAHCIVERTAAMHALSRELAAPSVHRLLANESINMRTLSEVSVSSESERSTDCRGEAFVKTKFIIVNRSRHSCMQLEQLRIHDGGRYHTVDLAKTALLLPHTKAKPSYSMYVMLIPLSQLYPAQMQFAVDAAAGVDDLTLQACSRFAERGAKQRFQPRWPRYEFTWRFREVQANEPATAAAAATHPGLWKRLGF